MNYLHQNTPSRRSFLKTSIAASTLLGATSLPLLGSDVAKRTSKIKALLITGGGYHDFESQKTILTEGVGKFVDIDWTVLHQDNADKLKKTLSEKGWADPYDVIVYNICHAHEKDTEYVNSLVKVHKEGKAMVAIHCTMHSYHWNTEADASGEKEWNQLLGVVSMKHGPRGPGIKMTQTESRHDSYTPANKEWSTPKGELYHIEKVYPTATVLAHGNNGKSEHPTIWVNKYEKANVFATSIGHHNQTMQDDAYLKTIADGITWAVTQTKLDLAKS